MPITTINIIHKFWKLKVFALNNEATAAAAAGGGGGKVKRTIPAHHYCTSFVSVKAVPHVSSPCSSEDSGAAAVLCPCRHTEIWDGTVWVLCFLAKHNLASPWYVYVYVR